MDVRKAVFDLFETLPIDRCDRVMLSKSRIYESNRSPVRLYRAVLRVLFPFIAPRLPYDELVVVAARWTVKDLTPVLREALLEAAGWRAAPWDKPATLLQAPSQAHAGLQLADYYGWACHRQQTKGERNWKDATRKNGRVVSDYQPFLTRELPGGPEFHGRLEPRPIKRLYLHRAQHMQSFAL